MTGYTDPDLLPFPNDYNLPADVPADMEALAVATQTVITQQQSIISALAPIGVILMWPQASAPAGWHLCNGTAHGSPELLAVLGSDVTPNLVDKFVVAAGGQYAAGGTGGAASVTLTAAQSGLRDHGHSTGNASAPHGHSITKTTVYGPYNGSNQDGDITPRSSPTKWASLVNTASGTGTEANSHTHVVNNSGAADAAAAHENRPPYYALTYIIRKS